MNNILQSYLDYLINVELKQEYAQMNNKKNYIEYEIQNILKQNPKIIGNSIKYELEGGGSLKSEDLDNLRKLKELFQAYTSTIKENANAMNLENVKQLLDHLKVQLGQTGITLEKLMGPNHIPQNLETVLTSIDKNGNPGNLYDQVTTLYKTQLPTIQKPADFQEYKTLLTNLQTFQQTYVKTKDEREKFNQTELNNLKTQIELQQKQINDKLEKINEAIRTYKDENKKIEEIFKNPQITKLEFIDPNKEKETVHETKRIYNQLLTPGSNKIEQLNENIAQLLNDVKSQGEIQIKPENVSALYDGVFVMDPKTNTIKVESQRNKVKKSEEKTSLQQQIERDQQQRENLQNKGKPLSKELGGGSLEEINVLVKDFTTRVDGFKEKFDEYKIELSEYNMNQVKQIYHVIYSLMVLTNSIYNVPNYTIFKNVGRGTINFYLRIINNVFDDLHNKKKYKDPLVAEIRKKHYVTVIKLKYFLEKISEEFKSSSDKLSLEKTGNSYVKQMFTLLSHFRKTLEDYSIQGLSRVSIYSRINYIRGDRTRNDFNNYNQLAMFFSDAERRETEKEFKFNVDISKLNNISPSGDPTKSKQNVKRMNFAIEKAKSNKRDDRLMWVQKNTCEPAKSDPNLPDYRAVHFTEVFDYTQYGDNESISRYMNLATRLSTGNGICLITYGYSGTGKTYTLFGNIDKSGKETKGLLQSTLSQLNGLVGVHFRLFELYGYGFSHSDYWKNPNNTPRIKDINHEVFEYKLALSGDTITIDKIEQYDSTNIQYFVEHIQRLRGHDLDREFENFYDKVTDKGKNAASSIKELHDSQAGGGTKNAPLTTNKQAVPSHTVTISTPVHKHDFTKLNYLFVDGKNIEEVFGKFSKLTSEVDVARKTGRTTTESTSNKRRIRDTPNNIESSRSVLVYDFILGIKEGDKIKLVSFLIVDLPGREEIAKTFVDPFTYDPIKQALQAGYQKELGKLQQNNAITTTHFDQKDIDTIKKQLPEDLNGDARSMLEKWEKKLNDINTQSTNTNVPQPLWDAINQLKVCDLYDNIVQIYNTNANSSLTNKIYDFDLKVNKSDDFLYDLVQTEGKFENYFEEVKALLLAMTLNPLCIPLFTHNIFKKFIEDKNKEFEEIINKQIPMKFTVVLKNEKKNIYDQLTNIIKNIKQINNVNSNIAQPNGNQISNTPYTQFEIEGLFNMQNEIINSRGTKLGHFFDEQSNNNFDGSQSVNFFKDPIQWKRGGGYSKVFKNRQLRIVSYIHLMNRLILLNRTDLIKELYERIIEHKINRFIREYIHSIDESTFKQFIDDLIKKNFKGQFLKEELEGKGFVNKIEICKFDENNKVIKVNDFIDQKTKEAIYNIVKYDYFINGFEGLYINENIMGLIKYLSDEKITNKESGKVEDQKKDGKDYNFQIQQREARLMLISKDIMPEDDTTPGTTPTQYDEKITELFNLRKSVLPTLKFKYDELIKYEEIKKKKDALIKPLTQDEEKIYNDLERKLLEEYKIFIEEKYTEYTEGYNKLVMDNSDIINDKTTLENNIKLINNGNFNDKVTELKGKSIEYNKKYKEGLKSYIEEYEKWNLERDYVKAVGKLYEKVHKRLLKDGFIIQENIPSIVYEYFKQLDGYPISEPVKDTEKVNIMRILLNKTVNKIGLDQFDYGEYKNNTIKDGELFLNGVNNVNWVKENIFTNESNKTSVMNTWNNNTLNSLYNQTKSNYSTLETNFGILWLAVTLHNYLYKYIKKGLIVLNETNETVKSLRFRILFNKLPYDGDDWAKTQTIENTLKKNLDGKSLEFIYSEFENFVTKVNEKRMSDVINQQNLYDLCKNPTLNIEDIKADTITNKYGKDLPKTTPSPITTILYSDLNSTNNIFDYKYKEVKNLLHNIEKAIIDKTNSDIVKRQNLLGGIISELTQICNEMAMIIGLNTDFSTTFVNVSTINSLPTQTTPLDPLIFTYMNSITDNNTIENIETNLEGSLLDATITVISTLPTPSMALNLPLNVDIRTKYSYGNTNSDLLIKTTPSELVPNSYSLMNQIYIYKKFAQIEQMEKLTKGLSKGATDYKKEIATLFNISLQEYEEFEKKCGHLFKGGMRYKKNNNNLAIQQFYNYINNNYSSSKIFCSEFPIIQNILESYLPPNPNPQIKEVDWKKSYVADFKVFYLFANYDEKNKGLNQLKCKNQYDLLENTLEFIEAIYN